MYLVSLYFDEQTNEYLKHLMKQVYKKIGNDSMMDIPAHLTLASFHDEEQQALESFYKIIAKPLELEFVSIGFFLPSVLYVQPLLSKELEELMNEVHGHIQKGSDKYQPYHWIPHITLCKYLKNSQLSSCLEAVQNEFKPFKGKVTKIGLATTNPYRDICVLEIKK